MIESYIRPYYQAILVDPLAVRLKHVHPCWLTLLGLLAGLLVIPVLLLLQQPWLACGLLLLSGYLDSLDGTVARTHGKDSQHGCALDIIADRAVEFAVILALFLIDTQVRALPSIFMLGSILICITSFLVVGIFTPNNSQKGFHYSSGLIERAEAFIFFIAMILLPQWFNLLAWSFTVLVLGTAAMRIYQFTVSAVSEAL